MSCGKHIVRYAVIAGLVGGTAALVAGPERLGALFTQFRNMINSTIDGAIEDPVALRMQMRQLEGEYPKRIAEVRGDLAEVRQQISQLKREQAVSERVVSLAIDDHAQMQDLLTKAEATQATVSLASESGEAAPAVIRVVFNGESLDMRQAVARSTQIQQVRASYASRIGEIERDLTYLAQQESRLAQLAEQLGNEHQDFQAQMWQMDRQVDSIARNDRLIAVMEKRQRTLDEQSRYEAGSLDHLAGRFADIRAKQEARLELLGQASNAVRYEDRAKVDIDARNLLAKPAPKAKVIEITPGSEAPTPAKSVVLGR